LKNKVIVVGAKPLATGARATTLSLGEGEPIVVGAEGIPPLITGLPQTTLHPGAYRSSKTYSGTGERQRRRILRQQQKAKS